MGVFSNKISRDNLQPGDHIYSWRTAYIYSHHGIYVGNGEVIHFTQAGGLETGTETFFDKIIVSSVPKQGGKLSCLVCGDQSNLDGVISSCLDCFLAGGKLYLYEYGVSPALFMVKPRGGSYSLAPSDSPEQVLHRAKFLLLRNGFGVYNLLTNNCEDFAIYCKTGLIVLSKLGSSGQANSVSALIDLSKLGSSGQANSVSAARDGFAGFVKSVSVSSTARYVFTSTAGFGVTGFGGLAVGGLAVYGYGTYCVGRLNADIGVRKDANKYSVEGLVDVIAIIQGGSDNKKCS